MILQGWPDTQNKTPDEAKAFFGHRDELILEDGVVYKGSKVVIPQPCQADMIEKTHHSHTGIEACLRRAHDVLFWPGMAAQIREVV